jgi:uncharacterized membrane protein
MPYGPQIGISREGYPVYLYTDPATQLTRFVVVLPDGRAFFSDKQGRILATPADTTPEVAGAILGGLIGLVFGPEGAILGALLGAVAGGLSKKRGT